MPAPDLLGLFIEPFNRLALDYMVTGAVAAIVYGEPRLTHDIDVVMALRAADAPRVVAAFPAPDFYAPPAEVIALEVGRPTRGHFNLIAPRFPERPDPRVRPTRLRAGRGGIAASGSDRAVRRDRGAA